MPWRLGTRASAEDPCCHRRSDGKLCNQHLDQHNLHATTCKHGQAVFRQHNALVQVLHTCAKEAGLWATTNVIVPEFTKTKPNGEVLEAELGLATWSPETA